MTMVAPVTLPAGPPPVMARMKPDVLNAATKAPMKEMMISGFRVAMVTFQSLPHVPAPSMSAAS